MNAEPDFRIRELGETVLSVRSDLSIEPRLDGDEPGYVIEDPVNSRFFRIGVPEYTFLSLLDGNTPVREALAITAEAEPEHAFDEQQAATICQWLVENQLAFSDESGRSRRLAAESTGPSAGQWMCWNPLFLRIPLFHPDWLLSRLLPWTGWLFTWPAVALGLLLGFAALVQVGVQWDRLTVALAGILSTGRWLWLGIGWLALKMIHELAHGIVCKRNGGSVPEGGVVLILAAPVAYVDVTASWRFRSKWARIHTALAGIQVELLVASIAILAWSQMRTGVVSDFCCQLALMASVGTILFNANPLMRFDGYYVLSDLLEIPNLYGQGQRFVSAFARRCLLGVPLPARGSFRDMFASAYGVLAFIWRLVVCTGLLLMASHFFNGLGVIVAAVGALIWFGPGTVSAIKYALFDDAFDLPTRWRCILIVLGIGVVLAIGMFGLPWPLAYQAPCIVDYSPTTVVRTATPGFVQEIRVQPGQEVAEGQILAILENRTARLHLAEYNLAAEHSANRLRGLLHRGEMAEYQAELENHVAVVRRQREKQQDVDGLIVRSPVDGRVVAAELDSYLGRYIERGAELMAIGREECKQLRLSIAQADVEDFSASLNQPVRARFRGGVRMSAPLSSVSPQASLTMQERGLCAPLGGPLPVRSVPVDDDSANEPLELLVPRFSGAVLLTDGNSLELQAGQRGTVTLGVRRSIARHLLSRFPLSW